MLDTYSFHASCLVCSVCQNKLNKTTARFDGQKIYCTRHEPRPEQSFLKKLLDVKEMADQPILISQPAAFQVAKYNIHPMPSIELAIPPQHSFNVYAYLVDAGKNLIRDGFCSGDVRSVKAGQTRVDFPGLKLNKMTPIKQQVRCTKGDKTHHDYMMMFHLGGSDRCLFSRPFTIVSSTKQLTVDTRNTVRPRSSGIVSEDRNEDSPEDSPTPTVRSSRLKAMMQKQESQTHRDIEHDASPFTPPPPAEGSPLVHASSLTQLHSTLFPPSSSASTSDDKGSDHSTSSKDQAHLVNASSLSTCLPSLPTPPDVRNEQQRLLQQLSLSLILGQPQRASEHAFQLAHIARSLHQTYQAQTQQTHATQAITPQTPMTDLTVGPVNLNMDALLSSIHSYGTDAKVALEMFVVTAPDSDKKHVGRRRKRSGSDDEYTEQAQSRPTKIPSRFRRSQEGYVDDEDSN